MNRTKRQARLAGLLYALVAVIGPLSLIYIPGKLIVAGDAAATADHIRASGSLLRIGVASELAYQSIEVFLVLALYGLFETVSKPLARQMAVLGLVPIPIVFVNLLNELAAQTLASGANVFAAIGRPQLDAMAALFLFLHGQGLQVASVFWGLWLFPFGLLIVRCRFIPAALGVFAMVAGCGYVLGSIASLVLPRAAAPLGMLAGALEVGELPIIIWLLIWGAKEPPAGSAAPRDPRAALSR